MSSSPEEVTPQDSPAAEAPSHRQFPCKQCGAKLVFAPGVAALKCKYCDFENPIPPGTEQFWVPAWGTWTSMGIPYYRGTTTSPQGEAYLCGSACLTQSGSSEYSFVGSFSFPAGAGALAASFISGLDIADSNGYLGAADFLDQVAL